MPGTKDLTCAAAAPVPSAASSANAARHSPGATDRDAPYSCAYRAEQLCFQNCWLSSTDFAGPEAFIMRQRGAPVSACSDGKGRATWACP